MEGRGSSRRGIAGSPRERELRERKTNDWSVDELSSYGTLCRILSGIITDI